MMKNSLVNKHHYYNDLRLNVRAIIGICLGVFLFLLFFQPFNLRNSDFNKQLLTLAGFGGISLLLFALMRLFIPAISPGIFSDKKWNPGKEIFYDFLFVVLNSVAFSFFARYVGKIPVNFHVEIIIVIIGITSVVVLVLVNEFHYLKRRLHLLNPQVNNSESTEPPEENIKIEFESENKTEFFQVLLREIILIKSANNYIEVNYIDDNKLHKKLIRSTLKSTETLFAKYPTLIRCHRSCMVNKRYIQKVTKGSDGLVLKILNYPDEIHVSRQYVLKVKEALKSK